MTHFHNNNPNSSLFAGSFYSDKYFLPVFRLNSLLNFKRNLIISNGPGKTSIAEKQWKDLKK